MPNLSGTVNAASSANFRDRVKAAVMGASLAILGEADNGTSIRFRELRQRLAQRFVENPAALLDSFAWAVAANATVAAAAAGGDDSAVTDGDIEYVVTTVWDDLSGASLEASLAPVVVEEPAAPITPADPGADPASEPATPDPDTDTPVVEDPTT